MWDRMFSAYEFKASNYEKQKNKKTLNTIDTGKLFIKIDEKN